MPTACNLRELMGYESKLTRQLYDTARRNPQRVVFAEGIHPNMLKAAVEAKAEGICHPIILGNDEAIEKLAKELDLSLEGIEIVNLRHPDEAPNAVNAMHASYPKNVPAKASLTKKPTTRCSNVTTSV